MGSYAKAGKQVATSCLPSDMYLNNSNPENDNEYNHHESDSIRRKRWETVLKVK